LLESQQLSDYQVNINQLMQSGCELIVAPTGGYFGEIIAASANANPAQRFFTIEWSDDQPLDKVWNQQYAIDQAAFLAGYVTVSVTQTGKIGVFGGIDFPAVADYMDGFALGVAYYNKMNGAAMPIDNRNIIGLERQTVTADLPNNNH
jgi:basic membrane protein A and related proteins